MRSHNILASMMMAAALFTFPQVVNGEVNSSLLKKLLGWEGEVKVYGQTEVVLKGGEKAILIAAAAFDQFSRAEGESQVVLYRPALGKARKISADASFKVLDLDHKGASELEFSYMFVGQGHFEGGHELVIIDGWKMRILHTSQRSSSNDGDVEADSPELHSVDVELVYADLNDDGVDDVMEKLVETKGSKVVRRSTRRYLYVGGKMVRQN